MATISFSVGVPKLHRSVSNCAVDRASQLCGSNSRAPEPIIVSATTQPNDQMSGANLRAGGRVGTHTGCRKDNGVRSCGPRARGAFS